MCFDKVSVPIISAALCQFGVPRVMELVLVDNKGIQIAARVYQGGPKGGFWNMVVDSLLVSLNNSFHIAIMTIGKQLTPLSTKSLNKLLVP